MESRTKTIVTVSLLLTVSIVLGWFTANYFSPEQKFERAYIAYRGIEQPDPGKLDEWDRQMNEAYLTMKEAFTAGNKDQAIGHQRAMLTIIEAQEQFCLRMNTAHNAETKALPDLMKAAANLTGKQKTLAGSIVKNETEILKIGKDLNAGGLDEMRLWRQLSGNFGQFVNGKIDGSQFLATEDATGKLISNLRDSQLKPGQKAQKILNQINSDWKELKPLL